MAFLTVRAGSITTTLMKSVGFTWVALFYVTILLFVLTRPNSSLTKVLRMKWLCWLGTLAYGIYLFHQLIQNLLFATHLGTWHTNNRLPQLFMAALAAVALTLLLATVSWRYYRATFDSHGAPVKV